MQGTFAKGLTCILLTVAHIYIAGFGTEFLDVSGRAPSPGLVSFLQPDLDPGPEVYKPDPKGSKCPPVRHLPKTRITITPIQALNTLPYLGNDFGLPGSWSSYGLLWK